jgi:hypothetical protein
VGYRPGTLTLDVYVYVDVDADVDARAENFGHAMHVDDSRLRELLCIWYLPSS